MRRTSSANRLIGPTCWCGFTTCLKCGCCTSRWSTTTGCWIRRCRSGRGELRGANEQLLRDIEERKEAAHSLKNAYAEIEQLKDRFRAESIYLKQDNDREFNFGEIIGRSKALEQVFFQVEQVAPRGTTVLLLGETGTGKGVVARAIHNRSTRRDRPLVTVDCTALPANLIESELFGREKGRSPAPIHGRWGVSSWLTAAPCFSTKSAKCRWSFRPSCSGSSRTASSSDWAAPARSRSTCASSRPPTEACRKRSARAGSGRTCSTGSMCSPSRSRRSGSAGMTSRCSSVSSSRSSTRRSGESSKPWRRRP